MEWNWDLFQLVVVINTAMCLLQYGAQQIDMARGKIPARHSIIPGTKQKFLYWQDFYMQTYGDFLGLVWVMNAFAHLFIAESINWWMWAIFVIVFMFSCFMVLKSCLTVDHKPDWGYPEYGVASFGGLIHVPYFALNAAMGVVCIISMITGQLRGPVMWMALFGGVVILAMTIADKKSGHFDPLEKE